MDITIRQTINYPWDLLLLADPSREIVEEYIHTSDCIIALSDNKTLGVVVVQKQTPEMAEIMNLAVDESSQRKGLARRLMQYISNKWAPANNMKRLKVCTGTSGAGPLMLYQQEGFDIVELDRNYFVRTYPEPIWENGIQCKHRIILEKEL